MTEQKFGWEYRYSISKNPAYSIGDAISGAARAKLYPTEFSIPDTAQHRFETITETDSEGNPHETHIHRWWINPQEVQIYDLDPQHQLVVLPAGGLQLAGDPNDLSFDVLFKLGHIARNLELNHWWSH